MHWLIPVYAVFHMMNPNPHRVDKCFKKNKNHWHDEKSGYIFKNIGYLMGYAEKLLRQDQDYKMFSAFYLS